MISHWEVTRVQYPKLPPVYSLNPLDPSEDPFESAAEAARAGEGEAGDFFWSQRLDRIELAVVLEPEVPAAEALTALPLAMVAFSDALGAVAPPAVAVHFRWPDCVDVNGGFVGGFRVAMADVATQDEVPDWLVIGFGIAVQMDLADDAPGREVHRTTLYDEGCGEITVDELTESFARHFLAWINRWQDEGFEPIRLAWLTRVKREGNEAGLRIDLDPHGNLRDEDGQVRPLSSVLAGPSWVEG